MLGAKGILHMHDFREQKVYKCFGEGRKADYGLR